MENLLQYTIKCQMCRYEIGPFHKPHIAGYESMRGHTEQVHSIDTRDSETHFIALENSEVSNKPRLGTLYVAKPGVPWALVSPAL